ncbi:MAG: hypothetical protein K0R51_2808 [Cytophagaceae bacterium]|nr:hypothetical protein [Cytophagaceae bacterium]
MDHSILDTEVSNDKPRVYIPAGPGLRFGNFIVDIISYFVATFVTGMIIGLSGFGYLLNNPIYTNLLSAIIFISYYVILECTTGRTLGKLVTGTQVLNEKDEQPSFLNIMGRTLCRLIPFEAFSFLGSGYGWHDSISSTKVVVIKEVKKKVTNKR